MNETHLIEKEGRRKERCHWGKRRTSLGVSLSRLEKKEREEDEGKE